MPWVCCAFGMQWLAVFLNFRKYLIYPFASVDLKLLRHYGRQLRWRQWRDGQGRWWRLMRENGTTRESWWADGLFRRRILARPELSICPFPRKQMWKGKISFISNFWDVKMMMAWKRPSVNLNSVINPWYQILGDRKPSIWYQGLITEFKLTEGLAIKGTKDRLFMSLLLLLLGHEWNVAWHYSALFNKRL